MKKITKLDKDISVRKWEDIIKYKIHPVNLYCEVMAPGGRLVYLRFYHGWCPLCSVFSYDAANEFRICSGCPLEESSSYNGCWCNQNRSIYFKWKNSETLEEREMYAKEMLTRLKAIEVDE